MYCQSCGKENTEQASFCQYCGKPINHQPIPTNPVSKLACPKCGKDDKVQKVSSIYDRGVTETDYEIPVNSFGGQTTKTVNRTAISHTGLASKIAPPRILITPKESFVLIAVIILLILGGYVIGSWGKFDNLVGIFKGFIGMFIGGVIGTIVTVIAVIQLKGSKKPQWEQRMSVWNSLYYCSRDDIVFKPETNLSVPSDRINEIIYRA